MPVFRPAYLSATLVAALIIAPVTTATVLGADTTVVVRPGDTLTGISRRTGVDISTIVALNGIRDANRIYAGQRLALVPLGPAPAPGAPPPAAAPAPPVAGTHVVARGESPWTIARRYGVSVSELMAVNGISNPRRIHAGLQLTIPGTAPAPPSVPAAPHPAPAAPRPAPAPAPPATAPAARVHVVARGESMWTIARRYGVRLSALIALNGIANPSRIYAGLQLAIPGAAPAPAPAAPPAPPAASSPPAMSPWMAAVVAQRQAVRSIIVEEAERFGVPAAFALAVAWQESGWRQEVTSHAGAIGVMQLMPGTANWVASHVLRAPVNVHDARDNVRAGVRLLAHYLVRYNGNRDLVLAAYYQGQFAADRHGVYPVTRAYIASVTALEHLFGG